MCKCYKNEKFNKKKKLDDSLGILKEISNKLEEKSEYKYNLFELLDLIEKNDIDIDIAVDQNIIFISAIKDYCGETALFVCLLYLICNQNITQQNLEQILTLMKNTDSTSFCCDNFTLDANTLIKLAEDLAIYDWDEQYDSFIQFFIEEEFIFKPY